MHQLHDSYLENTEDIISGVRGWIKTAGSADTGGG